MFQSLIFIPMITVLLSKYAILAILSVSRQSILNTLGSREGAVRTQDGGFGGLEVACWPLVSKFAGSNPTEAVGIFRAKKSFGGEVKPSVPCRRFTACKRSLNVTWKSGIFMPN